MITIDEAIAINEYQMKNALEKLAILSNASGIIEVKYYEQMVSWLKELKAYRACVSLEEKLKEFQKKKSEYEKYIENLIKDAKEDK